MVRETEACNACIDNVRQWAGMHYEIQADNKMAKGISYTENALSLG